MRESRAAAVSKMRRQNAAGVPAPPSRKSRPPRPFAQDLPRAASRFCSTHLPSRISRIPLKTKDRATLYPSQTEKPFSRESAALSAREAQLRKALGVVSEAGKS